MNQSWYDRTELLIGTEKIEKMKSLKVTIIGLGGVGGSCAEALCRAGIGNLMIIDGDIVDVTNINRQVIATHVNVGKAKVNEMNDRLKSINPEVDIISREEFCLPENSDFIFEYRPDYIVDAIDTMTMKIYLIEKALKHNVKIISCMGMGNRFDPSMIRYGSIEETKGSGCKVSRIIRSKLRKNKIYDVNVVYSLERPQKVIIKENVNGKHSPGSFSCVPPVAGYFLAYKVIYDLVLSN